VEVCQVWVCKEKENIYKKAPVFLQGFFLFYRDEGSFYKRAFMTTEGAWYPKDERRGMRVQFASLGQTNVPLKKLPEAPLFPSKTQHWKLFSLIFR